MSEKTADTIGGFMDRHPRTTRRSFNVSVYRMPYRSDLIIVFAKYPTPGRVKTRLVGVLTAEQAAQVHRRCLAATLASASAVSGVDVVLAGSPDDADFTEWVVQNAVVWPQGEGDLGTRLKRAMGRAFDEGDRRVLVVGSDCPGMTPADVAQAFELLDRHDVVIGPALDGGYYLLGLRRAIPELFESIDWSSPRVLAQTTSCAREAGLGVALLTERRDVDDYDDIMALLDEIQDGDPRLGELKMYLRSLIRDGGRCE